LESLAVALLQADMPFPKWVRLLGVSMSSLQTQGNDEAVPQLDLPI
jgi:DNA polymerase-4